MAALCMHGETTLAVRNLLPYFAHETWNSQGCNRSEEDRQRRRMLYNQHASYGSGACGFQPWGWIRQARLRHDMWGGERWDDELGIGTRDDGVLKPSGRVLGDGNRLFDRLGLVERKTEDVLVVYPAQSWDSLTNLLTSFAGLLHLPLAVGYPDLAEGLATGAKVVCLVDPPADLPAVDRERLLAHARAGGVVYQSGGRPLIDTPPAATTSAPALADGASAIAGWTWAFVGDIADERLGATVAVADLFDAEVTTWQAGKPGERWGVARDSFNAGIRPGSHYLWRATVDLPVATGTIGLDRPIGLLAHRQAIGEFGIPRRNLWIYVDGRLVGSAYGWGESYQLPCQLPAGRHEILLVVRDARGAGGVIGQVALGGTAQRVATATWPVGTGCYLHAPAGPEALDRRLLPPLYRQLLAAAGLAVPDADPGDGELYRLPTTRGTAWVVAREPDTAAGTARIGAWQLTVAHGGMLHLVDGQPVLVEAERLADAGGLAVAGEGGTALVDSQDGQPVDRSRRLLVKLREGAGSIVLRHHGRLRGGSLLGDDGQPREAAAVRQDGSTVTIQLDAETVHHWTALDFDPA
jgi:hypothetical protein